MLQSIPGQMPGIPAGSHAEENHIENVNDHVHDATKSLQNQPLYYNNNLNMNMYTYPHQKRVTYLQCQQDLHEATENLGDFH